MVERVVRKQPKEYDLVINISPGSTKSTIFSQALNAWGWTLDPSLRFIAGSYSLDLSLEHADYCRNAVQSEKYRQYFPYVHLRDDSKLKSNYKTTSGGQRFSTSVGGTVTGVHAHIITVDDPLNPRKASSDLERQVANDWMDKTLSSRKVDKALTPTILIMQRLHENDCTGNMLDKVKDGKRIKHICLPADDTYEIKPASVSVYYRDGRMDPVRLNRNVLEEAKADMSSAEYDGQFGQSPTDKTGAYFKEENLHKVSKDELPEDLTTAVGWDLAASTLKTSPYTAAVKVSYSPTTKMIYVEPFRRFREAPGKMEMAFKDAVKATPLTTEHDIPQDPGQAGKAQAVQLSESARPWIVRYSPETGSKETRAIALSAKFELDHVLIVENELTKSYVEELLKFPRGRFKDQVDATTRGYHRLLKMMKRLGVDLKTVAPTGFKVSSAALPVGSEAKHLPQTKRSEYAPIWRL